MALPLVGSLGMDACDTGLFAASNSVSSSSENGSDTSAGEPNESNVKLVAPGVKLDIQWVIDNSGSMCQEQNALAANIDDFIGKITAIADVDMRLAVVTTDGLSATQKGKFHHELAKPFPPNCLERRVEKCLSHGDCKKALAGKVCFAPHGTRPLDSLA